MNFLLYVDQNSPIKRVQIYNDYLYCNTLKCFFFIFFLYQPLRYKIMGTFIEFLDLKNLVFLTNLFKHIPN